MLTSLEICAGAGGQALGLEEAGFNHISLVEIDKEACATLKKNRPEWSVIQADVRSFSAHEYNGTIDLLAGGVPCPPFSVAGKQLGEYDERDLFPEAVRLVGECNPNAVMLENVGGLLQSKFSLYRSSIISAFAEKGYVVFWKLLNASDYGVPQLRPRAILVALKEEFAPYFEWPEPLKVRKTVGTALINEMASRGWPGAEQWALKATGIAPTLVGGSKKHGGPDLGPTRAREAWKMLGVDGRGVAEIPPGPDWQGLPRLTVKMAAIIQGFPVTWDFAGKRTSAYRQVGNAFPPPVAKAVGEKIAAALQKRTTKAHLVKEIQCTLF